MVIAVVNHKGGVGKTTTATAVGHGIPMGEEGARVLLLDLDPQANLTYTITGHTDHATTIAELLSNGADLEPINVTPALSIIPSGVQMALVERMDTPALIETLKSVLKRFDRYTHIIIDCPPSFGALTTAALAVANYVLIPTTPEVLSLAGVRNATAMVSEVQWRENHALKACGIVITRYNGRRIHKDVIDRLKYKYGDLVFSTMISENITLTETPATIGGNVYDYAPKSKGALQYSALTQEILTRWK